MATTDRAKKNRKKPRLNQFDSIITNEIVRRYNDLPKSIIKQYCKSGSMETGFSERRVRESLKRNMDSGFCYFEKTKDGIYISRISR